MVWGSIAYSLGWIAISIQWTMAIAGFVVGFFIAPRWHKTSALTVAEYITRRLGVNTQKTYTYLFLFISLFTTGSFLYPVAKIVEVSTGMPLDLCILLLGGFCIVYTKSNNKTYCIFSIHKIKISSRNRLYKIHNATNTSKRKRNDNKYSRRQYNKLKYIR